MLSHNHPGGKISEFSESDLRTEKKILGLLFENNEVRYHGSILFNEDNFKVRILHDNVNNLVFIDEAIVMDNDKNTSLIKINNDYYKYR